MIRAVADRVFLPSKNLLEQVGDMMILTGKTLLSTVRPPYPYGMEFVQQFLFLLRLCWMPLTISTIAICRAPGLKAGNVLVLFGAIDRLGGFFVLAAIREIGPNVTAIILAGRRAARPSPRTSALARSARSSTPFRCWASTRSRTSWSALPGADAGHRAVQHLRHHLRAHRRHHRDAHLRRPAGALLRHAAHECLHHRPVGVGRQVHDLSARSSRLSPVTRG